jgi:hypothetical protein
VPGYLTIDGRELERRVRHGIVDGLNSWAEQQVLAPSIQLVPLDEGTLMESGHVVEADVQEPTPKVQIRYGTVYAARQHEELTWKHDPGRQAKYLETPFKAAIPLLEPYLEAIVKAVVRTGLS